MLLGGVLTTAFNWHWIFLVNLAARRSSSTLFVLRLLPQGTVLVRERAPGRRRRANHHHVL